MGIIIYPVGLLVLNGVLLFMARKAIMDNTPTTLSRSIAFLYREYEPHMWWWELVEMSRVRHRLEAAASSTHPDCWAGHYD